MKRDMDSVDMVELKADVLEACAILGCKPARIAKNYKEQVSRLLESGMHPHSVAYEVAAISAKDEDLEKARRRKQEERLAYC